MGNFWYSPGAPSKRLTQRPQEQYHRGKGPPCLRSCRKGGRVGRAGQGNGENDHTDACQCKRAVEIRCSMMSAWKKRPGGCLGNCDKCNMRRGQKIKCACPIAIECSRSSFPSMWSLGEGRGGSSLSMAGTDPA